MSYEIKLDIFEGPLDLLLYLIRKNEIDIYNIPIALIAEQYLSYLDMMRSLNLDLAGEYLVLASTNANLPLALWTAVASNRFDTSGNFIFTGPINLSQQFYRLQVP